MVIFLSGVTDQHQHQHQHSASFITARVSMTLSLPRVPIRGTSAVPTRYGRFHTSISRRTVMANLIFSKTHDRQAERQLKPSTAFPTDRARVRIQSTASRTNKATRVQCYSEYTRQSKSVLGFGLRRLPSFA